MRTLDTDYLVIGSGAAGMAFADTLVAETSAHVTLVDRHGKPGGHWNDAYPFVTLHQPSAFYGVNSTELGQRRKDTQGHNQGLYELATGAEISGYYDRVMKDRLLASGRVAYHPMCNVLGPGGGEGGEGAEGAAAVNALAGPGTVQFQNILSGERTGVQVRQKVVPAAHYSPRVPSTHRPAFAVAPGVRLVPPNALPQLGLSSPDGAAPPQHFAILGAGKTAMDAAVWLLQSGVPAARIQWVVPRDSWLVRRITTQPGAEFFHEVIGGQADQMQAFAQAQNISDLFARLEACGMLTRIDTAREPGMFHLATVSDGEVALLRQIQRVVRLGRVRAIEAGRLVLDQGSEALAPGTLCIDCTASAVEPRPVQPIFQPGRIVLQVVRLPQPCFSAALIAHVESHYGTDTEKNRLCASVPFPHRLEDYPRAMMVSLWNQFQWGQDKPLRAWIRDSRLDGFGKLTSGIDPQDSAKVAVINRLREQSMAAVGNLQRLVGSAAAPAA